MLFFLAERNIGSIILNYQGFYTEQIVFVEQCLCGEIGDKRKMIGNKKRKLSVPVRQEVLARLSQCRKDFSRLGVRRLGIFGSVARDNAVPGSDVDILVEFEIPSYHNYVRLKRYLERKLGHKVDVLTPPAVEGRIRESVLRELVYVPEK
jgi:predicted nucleotidyltransferase